MKKLVLSDRLRLNDAFWKAIEPLIREVKGTTTAPSKLSPRMFVEAILFQARTGNPWRDLPKEFGKWISVYHRFRRWERAGLWKRIWKHLQSLDDKRGRGSLSLVNSRINTFLKKSEKNRLSTSKQPDSRPIPNHPQKSPLATIKHIWQP